MDVRVRRAMPADLEALTAFTMAAAREAEGRSADEDGVRRGVTAGLEDPSISTYWVLESAEGVIVGAASVVREWSDWNGAYYWWIQSAYLDPAWRGRGLLDDLIRAIADTARASGALELRLYAHRDNARALRAWKNAGFTDAPYVVMSRRL